MPNNRYPVNNQQQRIVNGYYTNWPIPYQLRLDRLDNRHDGFCGAVLISADVAISAAHCFWDPDTGKVNKRVILHTIPTTVEDGWKIRKMLLQHFCEETH